MFAVLMLLITLTSQNRAYPLQFREEGYVTVDTDGNITLTDKGMEIAQKIYERHQVIAKALIALGVDEETAYDDSCKIEHDLSDITFQKIKEYFLSHTNENI